MATGSSAWENKINELEARLKAENESHKRDKYPRDLSVFCKSVFNCFRHTETICICNIFEENDLSIFDRTKSKYTVDSSIQTKMDVKFWIFFSISPNY